MLGSLSEGSDGGCILCYDMAAVGHGPLGFAMGQFILQWSGFGRYDTIQSTVVPCALWYD